MRVALSGIMEEIAKDERVIFLTGDLGFMALEKIRDLFGKRFINAGVSEQNMIGVAAGLARDGYRVFAYSIAPFCYARPFEQIRNDVCFTNLPVYLIGNGGGYGYGYMGPTHHALEDCAVMSALPNMRVFVPAFNEDVKFCVSRMLDGVGPAYLRLGRDERPNDTCVGEYSPVRRVLEGGFGTMFALGPMVGVCWLALLGLPPDERPALYAVSEFNFRETSAIEFSPAKPIFFIEEHYKEGGGGMQLLYYLVTQQRCFSQFYHGYAAGYPSGLYGSQAFHRSESSIDKTGILQLIDKAKIDHA